MKKFQFETTVYMKNGIQDMIRSDVFEKGSLKEAVDEIKTNVNQVYAMAVAEKAGFTLTKFSEGTIISWHPDAIDRVVTQIVEVKKDD